MTLGDTGNSVGGNEEERLKQYKNVAKHEDMRRRRTECSVEIRKQKRDDMMMKRRQLGDDEENEDDHISELETSVDNADAKAAAAARQPLMSFEEIVTVLSNNPSIDDMRRSFESIRRTLSKTKAPPIDETIETGLLAALIQALGVEDDKVRFEAAWALTNIVSGNSRQTMAAVSAGATQPLIELMVSPNLQLAEQCLWAVANIAGDSAQLRDLVIRSNGLEALMHLARNIDRLTVTFVRTIAWAFSNMCRHKNPNAPIAVLRTLATGLYFLLQHSDKTAKQDACWAVSYLTDGPDEQITLAVEANLLEFVMPMLKEGESLTAPALRVLGNMATGNDQLTQHVIDIGTLHYLVNHLKHSKSTTIIKECCWLVSNVIAGTQPQIQAVIDAGLLPLIFQVLDSGDFKCQFEASWAIANLAQGGTSEQILHLWTDGAIEPMCKALKLRNTDILVNILDSFYALLTTVCTINSDQLDMLREQIEEHAGLDNLEALQEEESDKIYSLSYKIIQEFFNGDEDYPNEDQNDENQSYAF